MTDAFPGVKVEGFFTFNLNQDYTQMKITKEEVAQVAKLARLELQPEEVDRITPQLDTILGYVAKLDELDTEGVIATTHSMNITNAFREDEVRDSLPRNKALANAPQENGESFVVPRVIS